MGKRFNVEFRAKLSVQVIKGENAIAELSQENKASGHKQQIGLNVHQGRGSSNKLLARIISKQLRHIL